MEGFNFDFLASFGVEPSAVSKIRNEAKFKKFSK